MLANSAAKALDVRDQLKSFAYYRAGQSSHLIDKTPLALQHFRDAHETAQTVADSRNGLWGQFIASLELERADTAERLEQFAGVGPHDRDTTVRTINGKLILGIREGGLTGVISEASGSADLVQGSSDPIVRASFWHIYAAALSLAGNYSEALNAVDEALREIDSSSIEFARPHALLSRANANIGLRRYRQADLTLNEIESSAAKRRDDYLLTNATAVRCRLLLQTGSSEAALTAISSTWTRAPSQDACRPSFSLQGPLLWRVADNRRPPLMF
jgi:tetratricopeptide (TPR) repeat protein